MKDIKSNSKDGLEHNYQYIDHYTFCSSDPSLATPFKFKIFVLNTSLILIVSHTTKKFLITYFS